MQCRSDPGVLKQKNPLPEGVRDELNAMNADNTTFNPYGIDKTYRGGGSFTIGTGISWAKEDSETYLSFAYRNAHTSYTEKNYNSQTTTYRNSYNRLEMKFGFRF